MNEPYIFVGDVGTLLRVDVGTDITGATTHQIKYTKPEGDRGVWEAIINGQYLEYTSQADDFDQAGDWTIQAYVVTSAGSWHGRSGRFTVYKTI